MSTTRTLDHGRTRGLLLTGGAAVLALTAAVTFARGVDPVEVAAVVLFLPVFAAAVSGGLRGGSGAAVLAAAVYVVLRIDGLDGTPVDAAAPATALRVAGYLAFGALAGWASDVLAGGTPARARRGAVDVAGGGVRNARGVLRQLDHELQRARRYGSTFSVVTVVLAPSGDGAAARRAVGDALRGALRAVDEVGHTGDGNRERLLAVLPETDVEGAAAVARKVGARLREALEAGVEVEVRCLTSVDDGPALEALLTDLAHVVARDVQGAHDA